MLAASFLQYSLAVQAKSRPNSTQCVEFQKTHYYAKKNLVALVLLSVCILNHRFSDTRPSSITARDVKFQITNHFTAKYTFVVFVLLKIITQVYKCKNKVYSSVFFCSLAKFRPSSTTAQHVEFQITHYFTSKYNSVVFVLVSDST